MGWICKYCSTYYEDSELCCAVCSAEKYLSAPTVLTADTVLALGLHGDVVIPPEYHIIGEDVFRNRKDVTSVTLHRRVLEIKDGAFAGCRRLSRVSCEGELQHIGRHAFYDCRALRAEARPRAAMVDGEAFFLPPTRAELAARRIRASCTRVKNMLASAVTCCKRGMAWSWHAAITHKRYSALTLIALLLCLATVLTPLLLDVENTSAQWIIGGGVTAVMALLSLLLSLIACDKETSLFGSKPYHVLSLSALLLALAGVIVISILREKGVFMGLVWCFVAAATALLVYILQLKTMSRLFEMINMCVFSLSVLFIPLGLYLGEVVPVRWEIWQWVVGGVGAVMVLSMVIGVGSYLYGKFDFSPYFVIIITGFLLTVLNLLPVFIFKEMARNACSVVFGMIAFMVGGQVFVVAEEKEYEYIVPSILGAVINICAIILVQLVLRG